MCSEVSVLCDWIYQAPNQNKKDEIEREYKMPASYAEMAAVAYIRFSVVVSVMVSDRCRPMFEACLLFRTFVTFSFSDLFSLRRGKNGSLTKHNIGVNGRSGSHFRTQMIPPRCVTGINCFWLKWRVVIGHNTVMHQNPRVFKQQPS